VLRYVERARTTVVVAIEIAFELVAEVRSVSMSFFEAEHGEHTVEAEAERGYCPDPGFYSAGSYVVTVGA
jgi:hypothetical protein